MDGPGRLIYRPAAHPTEYELRRRHGQRDQVPRRQRPDAARVGGRRRGARGPRRQRRRRTVPAHLRGQRRAGLREPGGGRVLVLGGHARGLGAMEALTWTKDGVGFREADAPRIEGDGEALVRPVAVATCDLDFAMVVGATPFPAPIALGHECVAEVVETGDAVRSVSPGTLVSVPFQISCGDCRRCRAGRTANCTAVPAFSMYGFGQA